MPALAKCRNKRFVTTKDIRGSAGIKPHTLKNILDQTDVPLDARHNMFTERPVTSSPVTWSIAWAQNGDLTIASDNAATDGIEDKLVEHRPPHNFQAERAFVSALLARDPRFCLANPSALTE